MTRNVEFGLRLRRARRALGLTQAELAKRLNMDDATICKYERGRTPNGDVLVRLAAALQTTPDFLLGVL